MKRALRVIRCVERDITHNPLHDHPCSEMTLTYTSARAHSSSEPHVHIMSDCLKWMANYRDFSCRLTREILRENVRVKLAY